MQVEVRGSVSIGEMVSGAPRRLIQLAYSTPGTLIAMVGDNDEQRSILHCCGSFEAGHASISVSNAEGFAWICMRAVSGGEHDVLEFSSSGISLAHLSSDGLSATLELGRGRGCRRLEGDSLRALDLSESRWPPATGRLLYAPGLRLSETSFLSDEGVLVKGEEDKPVARLMRLDGVGLSVRVAGARLQIAHGQLSVSFTRFEEPNVNWFACQVDLADTAEIRLFDPGFAFLGTLCPLDRSPQGAELCLPDGDAIELIP